MKVEKTDCKIVLIFFYYTLIIKNIINWSNGFLDLNKYVEITDKN